ncbi:IclR family transcriptional regulator [Rhodococcus sp. NPDC059968]|uniref:IclR family transcriptional regulator n=1 Tax=Rhodococcus sp. NPDC059968 TaxID=3347017 RepID=UPI00366B42DF
MSNPGTYTSADNVLRLLRYLQQQDAVRVSDAADHLSVARSTAHRLLGTLCANGFARQNDDKTYSHDGTAGNTAGLNKTQLKELVRPHLDWLVDETDETAHLIVLEGQMVKIIDSVEATQPLRVGSRVGGLIPAHIAAAGKLFLAELPDNTFFAIYPDGPPPESGYSDLDEFRRAMKGYRDYAVSLGEAERGVNAVAMLVKTPAGQPLGAVSLSGPSMRLTKPRLPWAISYVQRTVQRVNAGLAVRLIGS